ncbi:uncharacterized protein LOC122265239 [Penaeus japonicus]|uniref:uncharacterized protein LOC122265239 n=1 Tax=Penaeus japonicus TaxID=27405 RepID=UPI001C71027E|nr:uncharacterized protein LOC122265239 [Penaeus japonicus]
MAAMSRGLAIMLLLAITLLCQQAQGQHGIAESRALRVQGALDTHGFHGVQRFRQLLKIHENRHNLPGGVILMRPPQEPPPHPDAHELFATPDLSLTVNSSSLAQPPVTDMPFLPHDQIMISMTRGHRDLPDPRTPPILQHSWIIPTLRQQPRLHTA